MTTTPILTKEMQELVQPDEDLMFDREGFDRRGLRRELAGVTTIEPGTKYVEQGQAVYVHPDSDMPQGPTVEGESFGNIELVREVGTSIQIPRYTNGFVLEDEDMEVSEMAAFVQDMRDGIMELFDLRADLAFLHGLQDQAGNQVFPGVFEWLQNAMDEDNIIDCSNFDLDEGDLNGIPANVVLRHAYGKVTGEYVTTTWDVAVARHNVWALFNEIGRADYNVNRSQWEMMQDDGDGVGVTRQMVLPYATGLRAPTSMGARLSFDIELPEAENDGYTTDGELQDNYNIDSEDDDVMFLIPQHNGDYYELYEQSTPDVRGPLQKDGFRERWEYKWRAGVVYGFSHRARGQAVDVIKLENVSSLFS